MPRYGRDARPAFTLVELLLVIALLGVLAAVAWPEFGRADRRERLDESVRRMKSLVAMCRAEAMNQSRLYQISVWADGSVKLERQADPLVTPDVFEPVKADWARLAVLLEDVWVESVLALPEGPPPVLVQDRLIQFGDKDYQFNSDEERRRYEFELIPVEDLEVPVWVEFRPDGTSDSLRWVLRDKQGRGMQMTLDGRLGRVLIEPVDALAADAAQRPPALEDADKKQAAAARHRQAEPRR